MGATRQIPFGEERDQWYERTISHLNGDRLKQRLARLVDIHSPTGAVREASEFMVATLQQIGMDARYMPMSEVTGNVFAEKRGSGGGGGVMLYAPIDTHLEDSEEDQPWVGPEHFIDLHAKAVVEGDWVYGLGASNPKAMIMTLTEVATALIEAEVPLVGDLMFGLADGGMPVNIAKRDNAGISNGVYHLLNRGAAPDFAVIMKPWNYVYHEEPGMAWFKLRILGTYGYAGIPRGTPGFRSSIVPLAIVIPELEKWMVAYAERNAAGAVRPQANIAGIRSGSIDRPSFPSAVTEIFFDARINPSTTPGEIRAQFAEFVRDLSQRHPEIALEWEMFGSAPGGATDIDNWIIQSARRGWEKVEGVPHPDPVPQHSGQTDGAALRRFGIPTARIGWPWPADGSPEPIAEGLGGMGATYIPDLMPCARKIAYTLIDTLTRRRSELGLK